MPADEIGSGAQSRVRSRLQAQRPFIIYPKIKSLVVCRADEICGCDAAVTGEAPAVLNSGIGALTAAGVDDKGFPACGNRGAALCAERHRIGQVIETFHHLVGSDLVTGHDAIRDRTGIQAVG